MKVYYWHSATEQWVRYYSWRKLGIDRYLSIFSNQRIPVCIEFGPILRVLRRLRLYSFSKNAR